MLVTWTNAKCKNEMNNCRKYGIGFNPKTLSELSHYVVQFLEYVYSEQIMKETSEISKFDYIRLLQ